MLHVTLVFPLWWINQLNDHVPTSGYPKTWVTAADPTHLQSDSLEKDQGVGDQLLRERKTHAYGDYHCGGCTPLQVKPPF